MGETAQDPAQHLARPQTPLPREHGLLLLYLLSGATGLCYEVLWARMLTAQFGLSIFGVAATVAAFLLGLGAGAFWAQRLFRLSVGGAQGEADRGAARASWTPRRALAVYALVELLVALYALSLPWINATAAPLLDAAAGQLDWPAWCALQALVALLLLGLPAAAVGASFPLVLHALPWSTTLTGRVYAVNTAGAAAGAMASLALLASLGWSDALRVAALGGLAVAGLAFFLGQRWRSSRAARRAPAPGTVPGISWQVLIAYGGAGACALMLEMGWTRLYGMVLLRTEYVLAIILAVYLLGTALGSAMAARTRRPLTVAVPLAACAFTLAGLWALAPFSRWIQQQQFDSLAGALGFQTLALAVCTLPATAALGAWLPSLVRRAPDHAQDPGPAALLYGANCVGGAFGAAFAVAVGIPALGTAGCIGLAAVLMLALGIVLAPTASHGRARRTLLAALPLALAAAWLLHALPTPERLGVGGAAGSSVLFTYEDALTLNHVIAGADGQRTLLTDLQHLDASSDPAAVALQADQARLPLLLHGDPRSVLFLGLGTGISASGSLPWPQLRRTAVEISPGALAAARDWFAPVNGGVLDHLDVVHDDARHFLAATPERYDVIVGDLFHPDLAGMSNLLSVEQFRRARARLSGTGVFAQWLALNQFDRASLHVVLRSFQQVFPDAQIFLDGAHLAMVGSAQALRPAAALRAAPDDAATGGEGAATWLGRYWGPIAAGVGAVQSETRPVIEFQLPHLRYGADSTGPDGRDASPVADILLELLRQRPDAARAALALGVPPQEQAAFASAYAASELAVQSWLAELAADTRRARTLVRLAYEANPQDRWIASDLADDLFEAARADASLAQPGVLERILRIDPEHVGALRALWQRERAAGRADAEDARKRLRAAAPLDHEAGAIGVRLP